MTNQPGSDQTGVRVSRRVLAVTAETDVATALALMRDHRIRHLPVVYRRRCFGLLTETDLLGALTADPAELAARSVGHLCHVPAPTVPAGAELATSAAAILAGGLDAALVVSQGVLVGIVTTTDVLTQLAGQDQIEPAFGHGEPQNEVRT